MPYHASQKARWLERISSIGTFCVLLLFTYAEFAVVPYLGYDFTPNGTISDVFVDREPALLRNDRLLQFGSMPWSQYETDTRRSLMAVLAAQQTLDLVVDRNGTEVSIQWMVPGPNVREVRARVLNVWLFAFLFWMMGVATVLVVRPRNQKYWVLLAFFYLTAIWLITGNIARWHVWQSAVAVRSVTWLLLPVYLHLHWLLPRRRLRQILPLWLRVTYLVGLIFASLEWVQLLPPTLFYIGFLVTVLGSLGILIGYTVRSREHREQLRILLILLALALLPPAITAVAGNSNAYPWFAGIGLAFLMILPAAYFYAAFRRQLGDFELRVNRLLTSYTYLLIIILVLALLLWVAGTLVGLSVTAMVVAFFAGVVAVAIAVSSFNHYSRWVERNVFGIKVDSEEILAVYAERITEKLDRKQLVELLRDELLPALLVRQSALIWLEQDDATTVVYAQDVDSDQIPDPAQVRTLLVFAGRYRSPSASAHSARSVAWVRLALPLQSDGQTVALWLLGKRDPDDFYHNSEISLFEALAGYTSISLINIRQAERLWVVLQTNIEQREAERTSLSKTLHDQILNDLTQLRSLVRDAREFDLFSRSLSNISSDIREIAWGLRPGILNQGLVFALDDLVDSLTTRVENDQVIETDLKQSEAVDAIMVEQHLYEIVKQACENALRHAQAETIRVYGEAGPSRVDITVADDGLGFLVDDPPRVDALLASRHLGLVGMYERAEIIGARLSIRSAPGQGTEVSVEWNRRPE